MSAAKRPYLPVCMMKASRLAGYILLHVHCSEQQVLSKNTHWCHLKGNWLMWVFPAIVAAWRDISFWSAVGLSSEQQSLTCVESRWLVQRTGRMYRPPSSHFDLPGTPSPKSSICHMLHQGYYSSSVCYHGREAIIEENLMYETILLTISAMF